MLAKLLAGNGIDLDLHMLEVGAAPAPGQTVAFHALLDAFASARVTALEIDPHRCDELNRGARSGIRYYARALAGRDETRRLYETRDPLCTSLYEPDTRYGEVFQNLDGQHIERIGEVRTASLDTFLREENLGAPDFIKIDVQGAELEVLEGGEHALDSVLAIVTEAEFVPLYKDQPLYSDIDAYLRARGFMLHTFVDFGGRVMKPLAARGTPNYPVQMLWTDALFTRHLLELARLTPSQLLKLAVLVDVYESRDVALHLLREHDTRTGKHLADDYLKVLTATGVWSIAA